ncbi:MAG: hypothetical protein K9N10_06995 [Deltaproteobacteria bacterium]|nr:hypothetical protein [Deltaproteobacteria bacterium]
MIETTASSLRLDDQQTNHLNTLNDQVQMVRENDQARANRRVENTDNSRKSKMTPDTETRTDTIIVDNEVIVEKYDSDGKLINVVPPGYVPLSTSI